MKSAEEKIKEIEIKNKEIHTIHIMNIKLRMIWAEIMSIKIDQEKINVFPIPFT